MGTKTIGLDDEAYDKLIAQKREGESFSETIKRITNEVSDDWRHSLGKYSGEDADEFEAAVTRSREATSHGLAQRQHEATTQFDTDDIENEHKTCEDPTDE